MRIIRSYKETGRVPERGEPRDADAGDAHAGRAPPRSARACSRTSSTTCASANLNVQETENIVFEGAEAAVARINLDGAPSPALCDRIKAGNADILDLQVVTLLTVRMSIEEASHVRQRRQHAHS